MNCLDIICRAMRRIGVIEASTLPTPQEQDDALETLRSIYRRLIADGTFGSLVEIHPADGSTVDAAPGQRIVGSLNEVELPDQAPDLSVICVVDPTTTLTHEYIFSARSQTWLSIDALDLTSDAILADRDPLGLACYLALELADEYGQQPSEVTVRNAARWQIGLTHNWSAAPPHDPRSVYF